MEPSEAATWMEPSEAATWMCYHRRKNLKGQNEERTEPHQSASQLQTLDALIGVGPLLKFSLPLCIQSNELRLWGHGWTAPRQLASVSHAVLIPHHLLQDRTS